MKKTIFFLSILIAFNFSNCNNANQNSSNVDDKNSTSTQPKDACLSPIPVGDSAKYISHQIEVKGDVENNLILTVDSLKQMKTVTIHDFKVVCSMGMTKKVDKTCTGVLLKDILEKAKLKQMNHKERNFYIVARATDNYKATFSWGEIFNNATGDSTYVIFEENGMPIKARGDMILICTNDIKTGPRHVFWMKSIEVNKVN